MALKRDYNLTEVLIIMKNIRIIPQLNIKGPNVVKPIHTEALRVLEIQRN